MPLVKIGQKGIVVSPGKHLELEGMPIVEEQINITVATTETATLKPYGSTSITTTGGASGTITLPDGTQVGQQKLVVLTSDGGDASLSVTNHVTSSPEVFTAAEATDAILFVWNGTAWATAANSGWTT